MQPSAQDLKGRRSALSLADSPVMLSGTAVITVAALITAAIIMVEAMEALTTDTANLIIVAPIIAAQSIRILITRDLITAPPIMVARQHR